MYSSFRNDILKLHSQTRLHHLEVPHSLSGPDGEKLFTDYFFTPKKSDFCLVHLSGVHGIEGYLGSLIQQEILRQNLESLPFQLVIVHAVNPFGMAMKKRTNAANVDLNRNSLQNYRIENPNFSLFKKFLSSGRAVDFVRTIPHILNLGIEKTARTVACGQSDFPESLFYSGFERQPELLALKESLQFLIDRETKIFVLDVHTGLGKAGLENLIIENFNSEDEKKFRSIFRQDLQVPDRNSEFYRASGTLNHLFSENWKSLHCFQEFGTKPFYQVLAALIHQDPQRMLNAFFPHDSLWKKRCIGLGLLRFQQLVHNFSGGDNK